MRHKVTAGRETEVQRVLEFEEYEAVSELQERDTLCDGHWKVRSGVPCVACNEKEDSVVLFHGDDFLAEGHDSSLDKVDEVLGALRSSACRALVQQLVVKVSFCTRGDGGTNLDARIDQIPNTWTRWSSLRRWKMRDLLQHHSHVTLERDKPTLCAN